VLDQWSRLSGAPFYFWGLKTFRKRCVSSITTKSHVAPKLVGDLAEIKWYQQMASERHLCSNSLIHGERPPKYRQHTASECFQQLGEVMAMQFGERVQTLREARQPWLNSVAQDASIPN